MCTRWVSLSARPRCARCARCDPLWLGQVRQAESAIICGLSLVYRHTLLHLVACQVSDCAVHITDVFVDL